MDVAIVKCKECFFSREAENHIRGFFDKLMTEDKQKMDVTLKSYDLKDLDHPTDRVVVHSAKVQIVIISHHFLQRLKDEASRRPRLPHINRVFRSKNVIAVLLAVTAGEIADSYESVLPKFSEWFSVDLRSTNKTDLEFCKRFTEQVVRIYNVELSNSSNFSVFPKKVTREQPKIAIVFKKPIQQNDEVRVELKTGNQPCMPLEVKLENPHTTILRIPDSLNPDREAIVEVSVFVNNSKIGGSRIKSELNMRRFDEDDYVDRMAKLLPPFLDWLDKHVAETLMRHYRDCTDYTADPELELMNGIIICKADILPTIMHFAAYYGLRKTAFTVLEEADGLPHCNIKNELDETPADIAFARGNVEIGQLIGDYQEIANSYRAYRYIKEIVEKDTVPETESEIEIPTNRISNDGHGDKPEDFYENLKDGSSQDLIINEKPENSEDVQGTCAFEAQEQSTLEHDTSTSQCEEAEQKKVPTPQTRRARTAQLHNRHKYVNLNGNPDENPEVVHHRERKISNNCKDKRLTFMPNYDIPRPRDQDYEVPPPEIRPAPKLNDSGSPTPVFKPKKAGPIETSSGYLIMNEGIGFDDKINDSAKASENPGLPEPPIAKEQESPQSTVPTKTESELTPSSSNYDLKDILSTRHAPSNKIPLDAADEQLIDLMNEYKNKTYDIKMVELLFESWKQRPDVQRSIEKKMEMLDQLRREYRVLQQQQSNKPSFLGRIKSSLTRRKKSVSHMHPVPNISLSISDVKQSPDVFTNNNGLISPTLTFTGPYLPQQGVNLPARVSESSYRTSIDSRISDSSVESDKPPSEASTNSCKSPTLNSCDYNNPLSKRFIPSYVYPNAAPLTSTDSEADDKTAVAQRGPPYDIGYQVPPPPRPVKPTRKPPVDEPAQSPNLSGKPPVIPEESLAPPVVSRTPPAIPAKPTPKYAGTEAVSPPPVPPPRSNNAPNMFSYIDYKQKDEGSTETTAATEKKSYENMSA